MLMHNPPHPGEIIKELCLEPLGLSVTEAAKGLGVSRKTLSSIVNGKAGISPEMAVRLSIAFNTSSESWVNQQINRRRDDGQNVSVRVIIRQDRLNMTLSTPSCPKGSGGRPPNRDEEQIFKLWERRGLNKEQFTAENLIAFLKQIKS